MALIDTILNGSANVRDVTAVAGAGDRVHPILARDLNSNIAGSFYDVASVQTFKRILKGIVPDENRAAVDNLNRATLIVALRDQQYMNGLTTADSSALRIGSTLRMLEVVCGKKIERAESDVVNQPELVYTCADEQAFNEMKMFFIAEAFAFMCIACRQGSVTQTQIESRWVAYRKMISEQFFITITENFPLDLSDLELRYRLNFSPYVNKKIFLAALVMQKNEDNEFTVMAAQGRLMLDGGGMRMRQIMYDVASQPSNLAYLRPRFEADAKRFVAEYDRLRRICGEHFSVMNVVDPQSFKGLEQKKFPNLASVAIAYDEHLTNQSASVTLRAIKRATAENSSLYNAAVSFLRQGGNYVVSGETIKKVYREDNWISREVLSNATQSAQLLATLEDTTSGPSISGIQQGNHIKRAWGGPGGIQKRLRVEMPHQPIAVAGARAGVFGNAGEGAAAEEEMNQEEQ